MINQDKLEKDETLKKHASSYYSNYSQAQYKYVETNEEELKTLYFDALDKIETAI